jgi:mannose-6-phosphate isomerase-like protein (cupin superfamily)
LAVDTPDAMLVVRRSELSRIRDIVAGLDARGRAETAVHRNVARPWGSYESIDRGHNHQVKRITVRPGGALSLQYHHHRAEHWIVVSGTAHVTCGDRSFVLSRNESTYIGKGEIHRLENRSSDPLELIEVQTGSYLGEEDIVRLDDTYGRMIDRAAETGHALRSAK